MPLQQQLHGNDLGLLQQQDIEHEADVLDNGWGPHTVAASGTDCSDAQVPMKNATAELCLTRTTKRPRAVHRGALPVLQY